MTAQTTNPTRENFVRACFPGPGLKRSNDNDSAPIMFGELAVFGQWTEINSRVEGHFMERVAFGAFKKTFVENASRMRVLLNHGLDPSVGLKPLGSILELREDDDAARYEVELLGAEYVRELLPGLEAGLFGSSFRMRPTKIERVSRPRPSAHNPNGIPEQTIRETGVIEFGPVTFAQYPSATAGVRSLTDDFLRETLADDPEERLWRPGASVSFPGFDREEPTGLAVDDSLYTRSCQFVSDEVWALHPPVLAMIKDILRERAEGAKPTPEEIQARIEGKQRQAPLSPRAEVAVIPVYGPIVPRADFFSQVSSTASVDKITAQLRAALDSADIEAIVLDIDSPGGSAAMILELGQEIMAGREVKPIIGVANAMAASGAYWILACCSTAVVTPSGQVGSIGVYSGHQDLTAAMEKAGVKITLVSSGPHKVEQSPFVPLSKSAQSAMQARSDTIYDRFVQAVADGRGTTTDDVIANFGGGRMLLAEDALAVGMVDKIATFDEMVASVGGDAGDDGTETEPDGDEPLSAPVEDDDPDEPDVAAVDALPGAAEGHSANGAEPAHSEDRSRSSDPAAAAPPATATKEGQEMSALSRDELKTKKEDAQQVLRELQAEYPNERLPDADQTRWDAAFAAVTEVEEIEADRDSRLEQLRSIGLADGDPQKPRQIRVSGREGGFTAGVSRVEDPFDFSTLRANSLNPEELGSELRDRAMRVIETARFRQPNVSVEDAQTAASRLLEDVDTADGALARHMLVTGSDTYRRAFGKSLGNVGLTREEQAAMDLARAASLTDAQGGFAVPFTLDPTVILTSDGAVNPIRAISRVAQTATDNWHGVTSAGVVAAYRSAEAVEAADGAPTLAQPAVAVEEADVFIPYSYAVGQDWVGMGSEFAMMIADAKDVLEADKFLHGHGPGSKEPEGLIFGLANSSIVESDAAHVFTTPDVYDTENALPARFRSKAQWIANRAIYNLIRQFDTAGGAQLWMRINQLLENTPTGNTGAQVLGYAANEASEMDDTIADGADILVLGDFRHFVVVDRIGMSVEAIPNLFGPNGRPTGQRGLYAYWRNSSAVLVDNAFRKLRISAT